MIQPWSKLFTERGSGMGGNVLGLERFDENLIRTLSTPPLPQSDTANYD